MVARQIALGRAVAVATVALLMMNIVPASMAQVNVPGQPGTPSTPNSGVTNIFVKQGEAQFFQSDFSASKSTQFLDGGTTTATLFVPIYQNGTNAINNVPVYWFYNSTTPVDSPAVAGGCAGVDLPGGSGTTPGNANATIQIPLHDIPAGGFKIDVWAMRNPHDANSANPDLSSQCRQLNGHDPATLCTTPTQTGCVNEQEDGTNAITGATTNDNHLLAYYVKDQYLNFTIDAIHWCQGNSALASTCDDAMLDAQSQPWNVTWQEHNKRNTFFQVDVGYGTSSLTDLTNWGTSCGCANGGFVYDVNISIKGPGISTTYISTSASTKSSTPWSSVFDLENKTGRYNVTVKIDPNGDIRKPANTAPLVYGYANADVMYRDYTGNITFTGTGSSANDQYPYVSYWQITGAYTFSNIGNANARNGGKLNYSIYLDDGTNKAFVKNDTLTSFDAGSSIVVPFAFDASSDAKQTYYIGPGHHVLHGVIDSLTDPDNTTTELNESNNDITHDIYITNTIKPEFTDSVNPVRLLPLHVSPGEGSTNTTYMPLAPFHVFSNISSPDAGLNVTANFSLVSNASVSHKYTMEKFGDAWVATVDNFDFANFSKLLKADGSASGSEDWVLNVTATDSSNNTASSSKVTMHLVPWPIFTTDAKTIVEVPAEFPNRANISWAGADDPQWKINVTPNETGFIFPDHPTQQNYTANLAYNVTVPSGRTFHQNGSYWLPQTQAPCRTDNNQNSVNGQSATNLLPNQPVCDQTTNNRFTTSFSKTQDGAGPGLYNYSILIRDLANHTRAINGTIMIQDFAPTIQDWNLSTTQVDPGQNFTINTNVTDDDNEIKEVHLNFTRVNPSDSRRVNLSVTTVNETTCSAGVTCFIYNQTFTTGRDQIFGLGGTFDVHLEVSDPTGNWNYTDLGNFTVNDQDAPVISASGVDPGVVQIGENATFWAHAQDATNVTVKLEVFRTTTSSELLFDPIMLNESADGNFTTTLNFSDEGVHAFRFTPVDSLNKAGSLAEGTIEIRNNVGPHFDIRSPSVVIEGVRYGSGTPRIEIVTNDLEGVAPSSIDMKVAGLPVDYTLSPAPGNLNGYLISYDVKSNKAFHHKDVVDVNVTAIDNSSDHLQSWLNFSFTVDEVAPIAKLSSIIPSYRDQPADVLNVSLNTKFTLTADDNDGLPTAVDSIRYRILGGGPSSPETVYTGPFHINDAPGVYTGPRLYQIQFWAVDQVGNFNHAFNTTTVYVDDTPPALFQFFPEGRSINATFVDDRVGVNRSVVWYRLNNEPYTPLPLTQQDGAWTLTLPEGVKGDRIAYYLQAWDRLDNTETFGNQTAPYASFDVSNHEPKVKITAPVDGGRVSRNVDLTWEASDEDGDALVFTVFYKAPGKTNFVELAKIENSASRRYTIDTSKFADGQYTFRLAASDGGFVKLSETTVTILNRASAVGLVSVTGDGTPGSQMLITAEITKAEAVAEARLYLGDKLIDSYPMNDEGKNGDKTANDGIYSTLVPVSSAGDYHVEIFTQYREDGELKTSTSSDAATFSAKLTPSYLLSEYGALIALIGLLAAVGIGVGVFVVVRRR